MVFLLHTVFSKFILLDIVLDSSLKSVSKEITIGDAVGVTVLEFGVRISLILLDKCGILWYLIVGG